MEPIRHIKSARFQTLKMYREDLDQLVGHFQTGCKTFTISDKRNRYENFDEMKTYVGSRIKDLEIQGYEPGLHFLLNQSEGVSGSSTAPPIKFHELRTEEITDEADALFYQVREFLLAHQEKPFRMPFVVIAIIAFAVCIILSSHNLAVVNGHFAIRGTVPWMASAITTIVSVIFIGAARNYLTLETRTNSPSFWKRNQDDIWKYIIAGIIGAAIQWLGSHFSR